ncbi:hypothetical protein [Asticcacaulis machinosus]|uniref:Lipoprotein n=1 Tax=Asticcacaulis machinosus TaxID=2984211 RepID=A0ABT5HG42_9CAUL|nr:hypothetical protein [Asticcacaulis machinosus]MDC7675223.1 hypothetical protein [Asticcacaulis machinosus]
MKRLMGSLLVVGLLGGCASPYRPVPFDQATSGISKIQVVEDAIPAKTGVRKLATNGQNMAAATSGLGLAGLVVGMAAAGIEAGIANNQNGKINTVLESQKFDGEAIFDEAFEASLKGLNYEVSSFKAERDTSRSLVAVTPQANAPDGSAVLDVAGVAYGYQQVGGTKWRPYVVILVRMVDSKDPKKILLDNRVEYNAVAPVPLTVNVPGNPDYAFDKVEDIEADPAKATEGLRIALVESARATAQLLK